MAVGARISAALAARSHRSALLALALLALAACTLTLVQLQPELTTIHTQATRRHELLLPVHFQQQLPSESPSPSPSIVIRVARQQQAHAPPETPSPEELRRKKREKLERRCYADRDYGMVPLIRKAQRTYCDDASRVNASLGQLSTYTHYDSSRAGLRSTVVWNLWVDLRNAKVFKQIQNVSQDGHLHDPRFQHASVHSYCVCEATQDQSTEHHVKVWELIHGDHPLGEGEDWQFCRAFTNKQELDALSSGIAQQPWNTSVFENSSQAGEHAALESPDPSGWPYPVRAIKQNAIIIARRDDHNPFFQIAVAMNAWIMMKVLEWTPETTQIVYFDDGFPAITDELQRRILSPVHPVVLGRDLMGSVVHFDQAMVAPFEYSGPMMRHLDNNEPCGHRNQLIQDFRDLVMTKYGVELTKRDPTTCKITVISRRPYAGRMVQRKWLNEEAILERMRHDYEYNSGFYKYGTCHIQAYDFVGLTLEAQMRIIVESDVVLGMHGAGMANVMWARPDTVVAEIFPRLRKRYGYRNLCLFLGCKWFQFRGGNDTGTGDNSSDKIISYADWYTFFDPIVRYAIRLLESRVMGSQRRLGHVDE